MTQPLYRFFHLEHIPYATLALFILLIFVLLPTLLLLLYPSSCFRKCLQLFQFRRWDIIHHLTDIVQAQYKDGTESTKDYWSLSALHLIVKIGFGSAFILGYVHDEMRLLAWWAVGTIHILIGSLVFITKPYKKAWMSYFDGGFFTFIGGTIVVVIYDRTFILIVATGFGLTVITAATFCINIVCKCTKEVMSAITVL